MTTVIADSNDIHSPIRINRQVLPRVACAVFACPECSWPLVGAKFSRVTNDDFHDEVFELRCHECEWRDAMLGREALDRTIVNWTDQKIMRLIRGA
jgi:RNase P subunit RPR2